MDECFAVGLFEDRKLIMRKGSVRWQRESNPPELYLQKNRVPKTEQIPNSTRKEKQTFDGEKKNDVNA